jgi:hypothetical protein
MSVSSLVDITSNNCYKCTATFRTCFILILVFRQSLLLGSCFCFHSQVRTIRDDFYIIEGPVGLWRTQLHGMSCVFAYLKEMPFEIVNWTCMVQDEAHWRADLLTEITIVLHKWRGILFVWRPSAFVCVWANISFCLCLSDHQILFVFERPSAFVCVWATISSSKRILFHRIG